ncbi:putative extracellular solute-binding protein [Pusillimonas sp. T7-7]|uniref:ABC transporter substrate-binding protein n=1 Tax=Pusillimonas sp. (strain T7-7) TaxID=1007105 RepID=UPI0002084ED4|nr:ABC transporter substrate-binding protein [Pusillimonas sp. T7-7]AEC18937.1 putative extracellular solute-binding protein [Pusillimonas sp. T7-7]
MLAEAAVLASLRSSFSLLSALLVLLLAACSPSPVNSPYEQAQLSENVLYTAFTQRSPKYLDPASSYSADETPFTYSIYEPLYGYHYLARPYKLIPRAAAAIDPPVYLDAEGNRLPDDVPGAQVATSVYDVRIKLGILFQPHPAFARDASGDYIYWPLSPEDVQGKFSITDFEHTGTRELTADDYVYAFRRLASPRVVSPIYGVMASHIVGLREYGDRLKQAEQALRERSDDEAQRNWLDLRQTGFDGVQAIDEHTLRIKVKGKYPQFKYWLAMTFTAPIPWEADRFYHQPGMAEHNLSFNTWPVGTGPYMMAESIVNRRHVLQRNPNFRGEPYPCQGEAEDRAAGLLDDCGKLTPFVDRVVFSLEKESVPLMGKFLQGYYDLPQVDRGEYGVAMRVAAGDSAEKAALYEDHGLVLRSSTEAQQYYLGFNWLDPVVGLGDTPEQQEKNRKLRQAISIAFDWEQYVSIFLNDEGQVAHGPVPPGVLGYEELPAGYNSQVYTLRDGRVARRPLEDAKRLLAEAGYPDGRDAKTGKPLILHYDSAGGMGSSATLDWMRRQLAAINVQLEVRATDYNRFQDKMRNGSAQMYMWGWVADYPDAENFLFLLYGPNAKADNGGENASNYKNPEYDRLFEQMRFLDDGPEKEALVRKMVDIVQHDAPWMFGYFPKSGGAYQAWVGNAKPTQMVRNTLQYYRIDSELRAQKIKAWNVPLWWPLWVVGALLVLAVGLAWRMARARDQATALSQAESVRRP